MSTYRYRLPTFALFHNQCRFSILAIAPKQDQEPSLQALAIIGLREEIRMLSCYSYQIFQLGYILGRRRIKLQIVPISFHGMMMYGIPLYEATPMIMIILGCSEERMVTASRRKCWEFNI